ncbi:MAG: hypothetical protein ACYSVY_27625, partial [Planctomycetota bacterium]
MAVYNETIGVKPDLTTLQSDIDTAIAPAVVTALSFAQGPGQPAPWPLPVTTDVDLDSDQITAMQAAIAAYVPPAWGGVAFLASSAMVTLEEAIGASWAPLGIVVTTPGYFGQDPTVLMARMVGAYKADGAGAKIRLIQDTSFDGTADVVLGEWDLPDSSGAGAPFKFDTTVQMDLATSEFRLEGQL